MSMPAPELFLETSKLYLEEYDLFRELKAEAQKLESKLGDDGDRLRHILSRLNEIDAIRQQLPVETKTRFKRCA